MRPAQTSGVLHVRSSPELDALLEAELKAMKRARVPTQLLNKSVLVRSLLTSVLKTRAGEPIKDERGRTLPADKLGQGLKLEVARELVQQVVSALERATDKVLGEALVQLPDALERELGLADPEDGVSEESRGQGAATPETASAQAG